MDCDEDEKFETFLERVSQGYTLPRMVEIHKVLTFIFRGLET